MSGGNLAFGIQHVVTAVIDYGRTFVANDASRVGMVIFWLIFFFHVVEGAAEVTDDPGSCRLFKRKFWLRIILVAALLGGYQSVVVGTVATVQPKYMTAFTDKWAEVYHSKMVLLSLQQEGWRTYIAEPQRGRQEWPGQQAECAAAYANRRRKNGRRGLALMRLRGELIERPFAHAFETGGMRRTHLRKHENIAKRLLVHIAGLNLALLMRTRFGVGKPRCLQGRAAAFAVALLALLRSLRAYWRQVRPAVRFALETPIAVAHVPA